MCEAVKILHEHGGLLTKPQDVFGRAQCILNYLMLKTSFLPLYRNLKLHGRLKTFKCNRVTPLDQHRNPNLEAKFESIWEMALTGSFVKRRSWKIKFTSTKILWSKLLFHNARKAQRTRFLLKILDS